MSRHFTLSEFVTSQIALERGISNVPGVEVMDSLRFTMAGMERVRAALAGKPVIVHSGFRSYELNLAVGGSRNSQHMRGEACDFICPTYGTPPEVARCLSDRMEVLGIDQLILEGTWVHISFTLEPRYHILTLRGGVYRLGIQS